MRDFLVFLPAAIIYLIFKSTLFSTVPVPDVPLLMVFYLAYSRPGLEGVVLSFIVGYTEDVFTGGVLGSTSYALTSVFVAVYMLSKKMHFTTPHMRAGSAAALTVLKGVLVYTVLRYANPEAPFLWGILLQAAVTGAFAPAVITGLERLSAVVSPRTFER